MVLIRSDPYVCLAGREDTRRAGFWWRFSPSQYDSDQFSCPARLGRSGAPQSARYMCAFESHYPGRMGVQRLDIEGAWLIENTVHGDDRGQFLEWFKANAFRREVGHPFDLAQANCSISAKGVLRGIHFADVPPGQAKYVTCVRGSVLDVIVDIRVGSPTFGQWTSVLLDDLDRRAVYLSEGLGHAFMALEDGSTVVYLCSEGYNPRGEHEVYPLDPAIGIDWPLDGSAPALSAKDAAAPTLAEAAAAGLLPEYAKCLNYRDGLASQ